MNALRTRLARLEKASAIASAFDAKRQTQARLQFCRQLGEVLGPYPEAKQAVGDVLERYVQQWKNADGAASCQGGPSPPHGPTNHQARREFLKDLGRVLAPYPEAKVAVGTFLESWFENARPDRSEPGCHGGQRLRPG